MEITHPFLVVIAHTRHDMPYEKTGPLDRTRVCDTFVAGGRADPRFVRSPDAHLDPDDRAALRRLARHRSSLSRADGWVEADLVTPRLPAPPARPTRSPTAPRAAAHDGFNSGEVAALTGLRRLRLGADGDELRVQLVGLSRPADFTHRLFRSGRVWTSATPFVGPAHVGRRGRERYLRKAIRKKIRRRVERGRLPTEPTTIEVLPPNECPIPALRYRRRHRRREDPEGDRPAVFVRPMFAEPVAGPIVLGYASHFGLGLLVPEE